MAVRGGSFSSWDRYPFGGYHTDTVFSFLFLLLLIFFGLYWLRLLLRVSRWVRVNIMGAFPVVCTMALSGSSFLFVCLFVCALEMEVGSVEYFVAEVGRVVANLLLYYL